MLIDPNETIKAPDSQGNVAVFGLNAGQQCVPMSLCCLIYKNNKVINSCDDLVQIMDIGNQIYSILSQSTGQSFLMLTELPSILNVFESEYELKYSESYTGTMHQEAAIEGYQYCTSLQKAFESLMSESYKYRFILTIGCNAVGVYSYDNISFKVFDSHARDLSGRSHAQGTCVLLELASINNLIQYFQSIHNDEIFEIKGIEIKNIHNSINENYAGKPSINANVSNAVAIYFLCYSTIKSCSYWNRNTINDIVDKGKQLHNKLISNGQSVSPEHLPKSINIFGAQIGINVYATYEGELKDILQNKSIIEDHIKQNNDCTGFEFCFLCYVISCIYMPTKKSKHVYFILLSANQSVLISYYF